MALSAANIVTGRLRLHPLVPADADEMVSVLNDERLHDFTGGHPLPLGQLRDRYRKLAVGHSADGTQLWFNWIMRLDAEGEAVGFIQATVSDQGTCAEVAWVVGFPWQGRGFASEAATAVVDWLLGEGVHTVQACIHPDHQDSARVAVRAGLQPTGEMADGEVVWRRPAWQWLDPIVRCQKAADALRSHGYLAFWDAGQVFPLSGDPFFDEIQDIYDEIGESRPSDFPFPRPGELDDQRGEIDESGLFDVLDVTQFDWEVSYDAEGYIDLLNTFSGHIAMEEWQRTRLNTEIRRRLAKRRDGRLRRHWGAVLHIAQRSF